MKNVNRNFKTNPLTLKELKEIAKQNIVESKKYAENGDYYDFKNGWLSTSINNPNNGEIFKNADENNLIQVSFVDKHRKENYGYLIGFSFEKNENIVSITVIVPDFSGIIDSGYFNVAIFNLKKVKSDKVIDLPKFDTSILEKTS